MSRYSESAGGRLRGFTPCLLPVPPALANFLLSSKYRLLQRTIGRSSGQYSLSYSLSMSTLQERQVKPIYGECRRIRQSRRIYHPILQMR
jgi:hypothetical protein